jgi:hypothetical protein
MHNKTLFIVPSNLTDKKRRKSFPDEGNTEGQLLAMLLILL